MGWAFSAGYFLGVSSGIIGTFFALDYRTRKGLWPWEEEGEK